MVVVGGGGGWDFFSLHDFFFHGHCPCRIFLFFFFFFNLGGGGGKGGLKNPARFLGAFFRFFCGNAAIFNNLDAPHNLNAWL